jgi:hypothetical protein
MCLGFDVDRDLGRGMMRVRYDTQKLQVKLDDDAPQVKSVLGKDIQNLLLQTKFAHWSYEEEVRFIVELRNTQAESSMHFWPFSPQMQLKEVILGPLCPLPIEQMRKIARNTSAEALVSKARLGFKYFEVKVDERYPPA